jgi:hypothetical protein
MPKLAPRNAVELGRGGSSDDWCHFLALRKMICLFPSFQRLRLVKQVLSSLRTGHLSQVRADIWILVPRFDAASESPFLPGLIQTDRFFQSGTVLISRQVRKVFQKLTRESISRGTEETVAFSQRTGRF